MTILRHLKERHFGLIAKEITARIDLYMYVIKPKHIVSISLFMSFDG